MFRKILPPLFTSRILGWGFLLTLIFSFFAACSMFYYQAVEVKMLPLDNKPEFNVFIDMPEGTALPVTANLTYQLAERLRDPKTFPEVIALQTYVGTSQPFDFNGMVRHYYLRKRPWQADIHLQLEKKKCGLSLWEQETRDCYSEPHRSSHEIAVAARQELKALLKELNSPAKIAVVEMPPGPPVLQSIVAEIYGPDDETRRSVAAKMTTIFEQASILDDVDNYMSEPHQIWRFEVNTEKAVRRGISVDTINQNLKMALGGFKLGDIKQGNVLEPTYIVIQVPLTERSQLSRLYDLPIPTQTGEIVPLAELGKFVEAKQDPIYYQKDLRPVEYVVGESVGVYDEQQQDYRLSAPIYGMLEIESLLKDYETPDGVNLVDKGCMDLYAFSFCERYISPPSALGESGFEWTGEWTVTYETFRDMGLAFAGAMVLIYILVVWLFGNFIVPAIIMVPIPLTLLGIIPGHWWLDAEFTATSMIGWIALAGIIVRNSILLVDYSIQEIERGTEIQDAVILACKTRTRPILITAFALVAGSFVILFDPIFQGMAISLLFGVMVSTLLTLVVIPLGCISIGPKALCSSGTGYSECSIAPSEDEAPPPPPPAIPLWLRLWMAIIGLILSIVNVIMGIIGAVKMVFYMIRAVFILIFSAFGNLGRKISSEMPGNARKATPPSSSPATPAVSPVTTPETTAQPSQERAPTEAPVVTTPSAEQVVETKVAPEAPRTETAASEPAPQPSAPPSAKPVESQAIPETADSTPEPSTTAAPTAPRESEPSEITTEAVPSTEPAPSEPTQATPKTSRKKMTSRRGIQLKTDLVTQYQQERGDEADKPNGDK